MRIKQLFLLFYAFTIYESGHSFNCGSVRKNEDKFLVVAIMAWVSEGKPSAIRIKIKWWIVFYDDASHARIDEFKISINEFHPLRTSYLEQNIT